jgi:restriction system protein
LEPKEGAARSEPAPLGLDLDEVPLINMASIMLSLLTAAAAGETTAAACVARLVAQLARLGERAAALRGELERRVGLALAELEAAGLLHAAAPERYAITSRGRIVLHRHPLGVDESVLEQFRDFRNFIKALAPMSGKETSSETAPESRAYLEGYAAEIAGRLAGDNPFAEDMVEHMAWNLGWYEAMDEAIEHHAADPGPNDEERRG